MPIEDLFGKSTKGIPADGWLGPDNWNPAAFRCQAKAREVRQQTTEREARWRHSQQRTAADMRLAHEILSDLSRYGAHLSDWEPIAGEEAFYNLRFDEHTRIYRQTRMGWEPVRELNGRPSGQPVLAFRRREARKPNAVAGDHLPRTRPLSLTPEAFPSHSHTDPEPVVCIQQPSNDTVIEPEDSPLAHRQVEWYEFQPGDTAENVTRRFLGYPAPDQVYDGQMRSVADPQPGHSYRVFMGQLLTIEGYVANAAQVELTWNGPTQGSRTLAGNAGGQAYWRTEIPLKPGHYQVIARLGEGPQYQVDFDVVDNPGSLWSRTLGMGKELVNQSYRQYSADMIEATGKTYEIQVPGEAGRRQVTAREFAELYRRQGSDILLQSDPGEAAGAQAVRDNPQAPLLVGAITALGSHGKSLLRHPEEFMADLKRALTNSRSETEALGELGMRQAHRRLGIQSDPRYVNRYHGPDEIGHQNKRLTESEAKASQNDRVRVAEDSNRNRQGSKEKNRLRAKKMKRKEQQGKVGQPSNRQGGPYQAGEIEMYGEIDRKKGNKQHILVHTNTTTGQVRTFRQGDEGEIGEKLDEFKMENFEEAKSMIKEHFTKLKGQVTQ